MRGVFDGARKEGSQRSGGCPPAAGCGSGVAAADAVAWSARAVACGAARVLAVNRGRFNERGRSRRGGCVDAVGSRWLRHAGGMSPINLAEPTGRHLSFLLWVA